MLRPVRSPDSHALAVCAEVSCLAASSGTTNPWFMQFSKGSVFQCQVLCGIAFVNPSRHGHAVEEGAPETRVL